MTISFDIPPHIQSRFAALARHGMTGPASGSSDSSQAVKEAALVELYRQGQLSHGELADLLGTSRSDTDAVLKRHNVTEDLATPQELAEQIEGLRNLLKR